jgi:hypothetical protein
LKKRATFASALKTAAEASADQSQKRGWPELWFGDGTELTAFFAMAEMRG